uniref:NADH-ubiquinone oxidoreductase chain 5 n=1 Tax=Neostromboceros nipponicus TaxID=2805799 RepID=A0A8A6C466_9HYME|nr:NADH dehydrogenase subunit 5 [Neostromboceros nipponicus]QTH79154.1 NADH dehydrogenase subunit 5 [Neostromboceros nipponicus]UQS76352.1 NADH dehydrogenase subunit 5 [Neostromboceros nipponicus]
MYLDICLIMMLILMSLSLMSMFLGMYFMLNNMMYFIEYNILSLNSLSVVMTLFFDWMSLIFLGVVMFISSFVIFYSKFYLMNDLNLNRFISLVLMFIMSMILLIISPNLVSILLGWDGLGLVSYCLILYYQNMKSFNAGMLTILSNRLSDILLLLSIAWMLNYGSWNFIFFKDFMFKNNEMIYIMIMLIIASFVKSAQIPFSAWLPAAMAAPTPVSSLVHSSTLVTAGVYLLIRFSNLFILNNNLNFWFLMISVLTMFMSGLNANLENDLKKIIAYSTLSQLGLMMSILFLGFSDLAFFHLLTHALFKSILFMCAGCYIHNLNSFQDIRLMGSLNIQMPFVSVCFFFANLSLCGFPFLAGFYSKDLILEVFFMMDYNLFILLMMVVSTLLTVSYSFRLMFNMFFMSNNFFTLNFSLENWSMDKSLMGLMMMVVFGGSLLSWLIFPIPLMINLFLYMKIMPLILIFIGMLLGYYFYLNSFKMKKMNNYLFFMMNFFFTLWFLSIISVKSMIKYLMKFIMVLSLSMDKGWTEYLLGQNLFKILVLNSSLMDLMMFYMNKMLNLMIIFLIILMIYFYY